MSSQIPDVEVLSPETTNPVPAPSTWERRSPDRPSDAAPITEASSADVAGIVPADARCQYRYQNATRCRLRAADSESGLCVRHLRQKFAAILPSFPDDTDDLSKDLLPEGTEFSSGEDVQKFLARLVIQVTRGRVSPRRAAVLGYLTNQLLNSHRAMDKEAENEPQQFIFDLPRPKRD